MLVKPPLEELLPKVENRYTLAILAAKRARQLVDGAQPMAESDSPNLVTRACEELAQDKVKGVKGQVSPIIPLRPEIEAELMAARAAVEEANMAEAVKEALDQAADVSEQPKADESDIQIISDNILTLDDQTPETAEAQAEEQVAETAEAQAEEQVAETAEAQAEEQVAEPAEAQAEEQVAETAEAQAEEQVAEPAEAQAEEETEDSEEDN